jgi:hypothetical protein
VIYVRLRLPDFVRDSEGFAPSTSGAFDVLFFYAKWHVFEQSFSNKSAIVNHHDFHCGTGNLQKSEHALNVFEDSSRCIVH